jgi:cell division protein ZapA (FtsZ GTPase activity inhibitor)
MKTIINKEILKSLVRFNKIKDRISRNEKNELYSTIYSNEKNYMMLSKNITFYRLKDMLDKKVKIVCNLKDRNGKIGERVLNIISNIDTSYDLLLSRNTPCKLEDRFLYNIKYNEKKKYYSLEEHSEYFEKIKINND